MPNLDAPMVQPAPPSTVLPISTHRFLVLVSITPSGYFGIELNR